MKKICLLVLVSLMFFCISSLGFSAEPVGYHRVTGKITSYGNNANEDSAFVFVDGKILRPIDNMAEYLSKIKESFDSDYIIEIKYSIRQPGSSGKITIDKFTVIKK